MSENNNLTAEQIAQIAASAAAGVQNEGARSANDAALKINKKIREKQLEQESYAQKITREMASNINCEIITVPEIYKRYQPTFTACVNGCSVTIPADGKPRKVHRDFALIIHKRMAKLSKNIANMSAPDISEYKQ
jgi:hypothetical protein